MPLFSALAESSAETSAEGIKKMSAENTKKKTRVLPNNADAGKLRMLSIEPVMSSVKANVLIFACPMAKSPICRYVCHLGHYRLFSKALATQMSAFMH